MSASPDGSPDAGRTKAETLNESAFALLSSDPARALEVAGEALALAHAVQDARGVAWARLTTGLVYVGRGETETARLELEASEREFALLHDRRGRREATEGLGRLYLQLGDTGLAAARLQAALDLAREEGGADVEARLLNLLAGVHHRTGNYQEALPLLRQALALQEELGNTAERANLSCNIGLLHMSLGQYDLALSNLREAYNLGGSRQVPDRTKNFVVLNLGVLYLNLENDEIALHYFEEALTIAGERGDKLTQAAATLNIGHIRQKMGDHVGAGRALRVALELSRAMSYRQGELSALDGLGILLGREDRAAEAIEMHEEALQIAREIGDLEGQLDALRHLGELHGRQNETARAVASLHAALALAEQADHKKALSATHLALSELHEHAGDDAQALKHYKRYHEFERILFNEEGDKKTRELTAQFDVERARHETEVERLGRELAERAREVAEALVRERTLELEQAQLEVVERLAIAAEERDDLTGEHTERVGRFAALIAQELGLPPEEVATLRVAARLHDVGKIGISDLILLKPGRLTPEEFERMKSHTLIGARILSGGRSRLLAMAEQIALSHHERWDGEGYPHGRAGEDIPLPGRIVAVADVFDALTRDRPYKSAWSTREALMEIARQAGEHFDPTVVAAALRVLDEDEG